MHTPMKEESVEREVPKIEIIYLDGKELDELKSKKKFAEHILENFEQLSRRENA